MTTQGKSKKRNKNAKLLLNGTKQTLLIFLHSLKWLLLVACLGGVAVGGVLFGYVSALVKDDPIRSQEEILAALTQNTESGYIYFRDSEGNGDPPEMGRLRSEVDRQPITRLSEVPQIVVDALLAIEDDEFMEHKGIDIGATLRAFKQQFLNEEQQTGGSTITQQLARNLFLNRTQSHSRKFKEILLAMRMERYLSKQEILVGYLNKVSFGASSTGYQVYGIKAAAKGIFDLELHELNLAQAAYLVGLPQAPHLYSAYTGTGAFNERGFNEALRRQKVVLYRMLQENKIDEQQYEEALAFDIRSSLAPPSQKAYNIYPFLMLEVEKRATEILALQNNPGLTAEDLKKPENSHLIDQAYDQLLNGGYKIYTTVDKDIYEALQEIASNPENFSPDDEEKGVEQVAAMMIDNRTGAILAMIEGRDYHIEQLNHATQMVRQPGSAMKPLAAYLPALESGQIQPATVLDDSPIILKDGGKGFHIPNNVTLRFNGLMTARHALNHSFNIPALKLFNNVVGIDRAWDFVKSLGITTISESDYQAATGVIGGMSHGVTVEELTNAYAAIPNYGEFNDAYLIEKITTIEGEVVYEHKLTPRRVFSVETGYLMSDMLRTVIQSGSGTSLKNDFHHWDKTIIAGKTGTTQNYHDVWFVGFNPDVTTGVWIGYDQQASLSTEGRRRAREIWAKVMNAGIEKRPELFATKDFERPETIVEMTVSSVSGDLPSELVRESGKLYKDIFNKKYIPIKVDDALVEMEVIVYNGLNYVPHPNTPREFVETKLLVRRDPSIAVLLEEIKQKYEEYPNGRPKDSRGNERPISFYIPQDAHLDAPTMVDPRQEDGMRPGVPGNATIHRNTETGEVTITFQAPSNNDIVGYRLYRSKNGEPYSVFKILHAGQETVFKDMIYNPSKATYYITAVDVSGNESAPTTILRSHPDAFDPGIFFPPANNDEEDDPFQLPLPWITPPAQPAPDQQNQPGHSNSSGQQNQPNQPNQGNQQDQSGRHNQPSPGEQRGQAGLPSAPRNVKVQSTAGGNGVVISWDANPADDKVTQYHIYFASGSEEDYLYIGSTRETSFTYISYPLSGWYKVQAENAAGTRDSQATKY